MNWFWLLFSKLGKIGPWIGTFPKVIQTCLGVGLCGVMLILAWNWSGLGEQAIREYTGLQKEDLTAQTAEITKDMATKRDVQEVADRLTMYQDSLGRLYTYVEKNIARPMINSQAQLRRDVNALQSGGVATRVAVEEAKQASEQSKVELLAQMERSARADQRAQELAAKEAEQKAQEERALFILMARKMKVELPKEF